jgi:transposase
VIKLGEIVMILDLHRQGLTVSAIARELGIDRKTVRKCIARGLEAPVYGPRKPCKRLIDPFVPYLHERVTAYPGLTGRRLLRELRERGYAGGYTAVTDLLREIRPAPLPSFEVRFETPPGDQATRRRSTLRNSSCSSRMSRQSPASSGCSRSCSASAG